MKYRVYSNGKEVSGELPFALMQTEAVGIFESMRAYHGKVFHEEEHEILSVEQRREPTRRPLTVQGRDRLVRFRVKSPNLTL